MADQLTNDQIREFREAFEMFDKDGSGTIDARELATVLRSLGQNPTNEQLREMISIVDSDHSGTIDFGEFLNMMARKLIDTNIEEELIQAFRVFDENNNGYITLPQLRQILTTFGGMGQDQFDEMISTAEDEHDGKVYYVRFVKRLMSSD
eukprot:c2504_g1_i1.p1 GENE.c2504_g1_i1~~c2504_g1_i1.p1  ORF type:complete len:150 (+),score=48.01 c2504_g1_i1:41-490(+)